jgi:glycosyltransferase involved in cell wall biosynthesis
MSLHHPIYVINLALHFGGGEHYTAFFARALRALGEPVELILRRETQAFDAILAEGIPQRFVAGDADLPAALTMPGWIVTHTRIETQTALALKQRHWLTGFAHMPFHDRKPGVLALYDQVYGVSQYVLDTLSKHDMRNCYLTPMYGVADFAPSAASPPTITRQPKYTSDGRKIRDTLVHKIEPLLMRKHPFVRKPGLTIGIVSAIGPIKQFDVLFTLIAPIMATFPTVHLEVFGRGGYKSISAMKKALKPMGSRMRFWGHQSHPRAIFMQLDYLLSGLPEKEALGLNIIEAQTLGTPVLAIDAPPFTETVVHGKTGYLYRDPREDGGEAFKLLLQQIMDNTLPHPNPLSQTTHLQAFVQNKFNQRIAELLKAVSTSIATCQRLG